jgi:DNA-binding transcriptional ArsR family regulator
MIAGRVKTPSSVRARPAPATPRGRASRTRDHAVERLARTFKALGDPSRSKLVFALAQGERNVSELAALLGASLSATSHQLRILRQLEIVRVRRAGRTQRYALNERAFGFCSPLSCHAWRDALARPPHEDPCSKD